ncbi:conserved hypothetical integral membrane protein [Serratia plymuthica]|nr:conserved hypothetical integral membrane protein [Serratia plymuthica]VEI20659.1 conserved hypothetical integral membrane protein [Serratia plymuthica]
MSMKFILVDIQEDVISYKVKADGAVFTEKPIIMLHKNLIDFFDDNDKSKILSICNINDSTTHNIKKEWSFAILLSLFITCLFSSIPFSQMKVNILTYLQPGGILIFPITFVFLDAINEVYGRRKGKTAVYCAAFSLTIASLFIHISMQLSPVDSVMKDSFIRVFENLPKLLIINAICVLLADSFNNFIYNALKGLLRGNYLALRCIISTVIGQLIYSIVWISIFFSGKLPFEKKVEYIIDNYEFKVIFCIIVCMPLTVMCVGIIKKYIYK